MTPPAAPTGDLIARASRNWTEAGWGPSAPGMAVVTSVMRAQQIMLARVEQVLRPWELTFARYELLMLLRFARPGSMPVGRASTYLQVHPTSVTSAVHRLAAAGLVVRRPHPTDGRTTLIELTAAGRERAEAATAALNATVFTDPGLPAARVPVLLEVLGEMRRAAGDF